MVDIDNETKSVDWEEFLGWDPAPPSWNARGQIYLDNNATTPIAPLVVQAMSACWRLGLANPSSQHGLGQATGTLLRQARESLLRDLGAETDRFPSDQLILTSGGTEANNLALFGLRSGPGGNVVLSGIEHPSVSQAALVLQREGVSVRTVGAQIDGQIDAARLIDQIDDQTRLVSLMLANNETGVLQPVATVAEHCRKVGVRCHTDAVQAVGKQPFGFRDLGVDALTFAPHKFHGPTGIGGLVVRAGISLEPRQWGGFHEQGQRAGTESVALAVGAAVALRWYLRQHDPAAGQLSALRDAWEAALLSVEPEIGVIGGTAPRLPQTSCLIFPAVERQAFVMAADLAGVACTTGSACASGSSEPSPTLVSMGLDSESIGSAVRFSWGLFNRAEEVGEAADRILKIYKNLRRRSPVR